MNKLVARLAALVLTIGAVAPATAQLLPPLPGNSLIVTLTSPGQGANVSGTIPVSASVSIVGSLTVSRVEFFVDGNFIGSDSTASYSVSWDTRTVGNGSHSLRAVAQDVLGARWTSNSVSVTVANDTTAPSVTINQAATQADPTSASPINFTVVFSESVSGFTGADVTISGTASGTKTRTVTGGPSNYNVAVSGMTSSGTVSATLAAGVAQDAAGNTNTASTSTDNTVTFNLPDTTRPTVTINQAATQADPTSASPINFTVVFSESVSGFTGTDVSIGGTAGATTAAVSGGPSTYTVAVSGMTSSGTVSATLAAGVAQDAAGNTNTASTSTDNSVQFNLPDTTPPAPTIASFTPTSGPAGTVVTITGTNFSGATAVTFNTVGAGFLVDSATQIRAEVPAGATTGPISVTTPGGTATSSTSFTVTTPAPSITSFTPTSGPAGTVVTITGTNFDGVTAVTFNTVGAGFLVDSATQIRAEVPPGATTGPISVTTLGGTVTSSTSFTVTTPAPSITSFTPTSGPVGTIVTISGSNFGGDTAVAFNGVSAGFIVDSATQIRAEVPPGATTGPISVTALGGTATSASAFTVEEAPPQPGVTRFEETDPAISASPAGAWVLRGAEIAAFSGGTAGISNVTGATVTFTFSGTAVSWIGLRCNVCGIATVSIDGGAADPVDTAGAGAPDGSLTSEVVFSASGLDPAVSHTMVITVTGNTNSGGAFIVVDAFDVTGDGSAAISAASAATRVEDSDPAVSYTGTGWTPRDSQVATFSGGAALSSAIAGDTSSFTFTGSAVSLIGLRCSVCGIATVSIDGVTHGEIDTASAVAPGSAGLASQAVFTASGLAPDAVHTLVIKVTGTTTSGGAHIAIDAFDVTP